MLEILIQVHPDVGLRDIIASDMGNASSPS